MSAVDDTDRSAPAHPGIVPLNDCFLSELVDIMSEESDPFSAIRAVLFPSRVKLGTWGSL